MINLKQYVQDDEELLFLQEIRLALSQDFQNEVHLSYKGKYFSIEPVNGKIIVFYENTETEYENIDDVFLKFLIDGKPFIERVQDIDYE